MPVRPLKLLAPLPLLAMVLLASGCDLQENADLEDGRLLFQQKCGTCHALAEAGTQATVAPDLDAAFAEARDTGMDADTIEGVVQQQIANPRAVPADDPTYMPPDLVTGEDAEDVAAYVASVAGIRGIKPPELPPDQLFVEQCGACHALQSAGTSGTTGPNLDEVLPGQSAKQVEESIVNPDAEITQGFEAGVMPPTFGETLESDDLKALVDLLLQSAGGGR